MPHESGFQRNCAKCGKQFVAREPHHKTCPDCFRESRSGGGYKSNVSHPRAKLPENYLVGGYFDGKKLKVELVTTHAEQVAQALVAAKVTMGQLRKFFTMARGLEQRLDIERDFNLLLPEIARLKPMVIAIVGRAQNETQRGQLGVLRQFIETNAESAMQDEVSFQKGFLPHFESVVAYFTFYSSKER